MRFGVADELGDVVFEGGVTLEGALVELGRGGSPAGFQDLERRGGWCGDGRRCRVGGELGSAGLQAGLGDLGGEEDVVGAFGGGQETGEGELGDAMGVGGEGGEVLVVGEFGGDSGLVLSGLGEELVGLRVVAERVGEPAGFGEYVALMRLLLEGFGVEVEGVGGIADGGEMVPEEDVRGGCFGHVAGGDEDFVAGGCPAARGGKVVGQFEADFATALGAITLPIAKDGGAVVVDGFLRIALFAGETGELEVDEAIAGAGLAQVEEVVVGLFEMAGVGEGLGEQELARKVFTVGKRGAEGGDGICRMAFLEGEFAAFGPSYA